jgi:hypothetical protein
MEDLDLHPQRRRLEARIFTSYPGKVRVPKTSVCTLPRMFIPAPWMTRIVMLVVSRVLEAVAYRLR